MITGKSGAWYVKTEAGKNLGGPYKSKSEAKRRLAQVEMHKHMKGKRKGQKGK